jgi:serine/threonine protein phosphatase 1
MFPGIMSVYVMSDLHGCKAEFDAMLDQIDYSDEYDELWIDGDICDRGPESIPLLREIMSRPSMHIIYGNHDVWFARYTQELIDGREDPTLIDMSEDLICWLHYNGGYKTADQFMDLDSPVCYDIKLYLDENRRFWKELEVHGKKFLLVHAGFADEWYRPDIRIDTVPEDILVWSHIGLDDNPYNDRTMIVGHTPTFLYGPQYDNRIAHGKKDTILHIDCGCVYGRSLGCVRLDDMEEFYVPSREPYIHIL